MNKERRTRLWLWQMECNKIWIRIDNSMYNVDLYFISSNQHVFFPCSWLINQSTCLLSLFMTDQPINMSSFLVHDLSTNQHGNAQSYCLIFNMSSMAVPHVDWLISHEQGKKTCWLVDQSWTRKEDMLIGW
jgi:hypothetical protein